MSRDEFDPRFDPAFQPGFDPSVHTSRMRVLRGATAAEALEGAVPDALDLPHARNPVIGALWAVCVALIVGGIAYVWWANTDASGYASSEDGIPIRFLLMQSAWTVAPAMIQVGLTGLIGLLFWYAAHWRPRAK